jgi:DNA-binding LacI/PurR family transcriptional regulator
VKRPTLADVASRAGVTKAAVSFALNGQPGVSAATRARILAIAHDLGFQPNSAARALSDGRAAVVFGTPKGAGSLPAVWPDDVAATRTMVEYLAELGHRRLAWVSGIPGCWHTRLRADALQEVAAATGLEAVSVPGDGTGEHGARATSDLLRSARPPTAILYDSDLMAVSGLSTAQHMGVQVPAELSIVAWDDSALCEVVHPSLTALRRDIAAGGAEGARRLVRLVDGSTVGNFEEAPPVLIRRGSTGRPARLPGPTAPRGPG